MYHAGYVIIAGLSSRRENNVPRNILRDGGCIVFRDARCAIPRSIGLVGINSLRLPLGRNFIEERHSPRLIVPPRRSVARASCSQFFCAVFLIVHPEARAECAPRCATGACGRLEIELLSLPSLLAMDGSPFPRYSLCPKVRDREDIASYNRIHNVFSIVGGRGREKKRRRDSMLALHISLCSKTL